MKKHNTLSYRALALGGLLLAVPVRAQDALVQSYCSSENTGSDFSDVFNIYQSNGACHDTCSSEYAFAIVQYQSCWCSNIAPGDTTSVSNCNVDCPGFPSEKCGNAGSGLYGYIALDRSPTGTSGASSEQPVSSQQTSTSTTSTPASTRTTAQPVTSVIMTTISGAVVTQTVTSTPVVAPESNQDGLPVHRSDKLGGGAIAGIVIGVIVGIAAIAAAFFLLRKRRNQEDGSAGASASGSKKLGRNVSVLSKAGLLTRSGPSMSERDHDDGYYATTTTGQNSVRHSMMFAPGAAEGVSPVSPLGSSHGSDNSRRASRPMVYDQRLNPSALFANAEANGSRISMQDQQDYSRPLGIANPDPRPSYESRKSHS